MSLGVCRRVVAIAALLGGAGPGCFYTDSVNTEPQAQLQKATSGPLYVDSPVTFTAYTSDDPDGDRDDLIAQWRALQCEDAAGTRCPPGSEIDEMTGSIYDEFTFTLESKLPVLVVLVVHDRRGAYADDSMLVEVQNRDPALSLQVQGYEYDGGYPLGTYVQIFATGSDADRNDELTYEWNLYPPAGSVPANVRWEKVDDTDDEVYELEPDVAGLWNVEVIVSDQDGGSTEETVPVLVQADAPPCIAIADPVADPEGTYILDAGDDPRRFAVLSVTDDLDPFPNPDPAEAFLGEAEFRWYIATPDTGDELVEIDGHEAADYFVDPSSFAPGDPVELRVEVADRIEREIPCAADQPTCSVIGDPSCLQRVTWSIEIR